jgi:hypothetical protein
MRSASLRPKARSPDAPMRNGHTPDACEANTVTPPRRQLEAVPPHLQGSYVFKVREERRTGCATAPSTKRSACWEALAETNEGDVRPLACRHRSDVLHLDLARDHLVPQSGDDRRDERQAILALVRDQHAQMLGLTVTHPAPQRRLNRCPESPNWRPDALGVRVLRWRFVRPSPSADDLFRLQHLAGVVRDLDGRAETQASGAAYVLLFPEPLERLVPVHG